MEHIIYAIQKGINLMTFDCVNEASKMIRVNPKSEGVLIIVVDMTDATNDSKRYYFPRWIRWMQLTWCATRRLSRMLCCYTSLS